MKRKISFLTAMVLICSFLSVSPVSAAADYTVYQDESITITFNFWPFEYIGPWGISVNDDGRVLTVVNQREDYDSSGCSVFTVDVLGKSQGTANVTLNYYSGNTPVTRRYSVTVLPSRTKTITATFGTTKYVVNGTQLAEQSLIYNNVAYYPAAYLAHALGCTTSWDAATNVTTVKPGGQQIIDPASQPAFPDGSTKRITVMFGVTTYIVNGTQLTEQSLLYNNVAYYPAAYMANALGFTTSWNAATNVTTVVLAE